MNTVVDLSNLREITGGDAEIEAPLFEEFISSSHALVEELQANIEVETQWARTAHTLKGIAYNLGAHQMGEICEIAQDNYAELSDRQALLKQLGEEHQRVVTFLQDELNNKAS